MLKKLKTLLSRHPGQEKQGARLKKRSLSKSILAAENKDIRIVFHHRGRKVDLERIQNLEILYPQMSQPDSFGRGRVHSVPSYGSG